MRNRERGQKLETILDRLIDEIDTQTTGWTFEPEVILQLTDAMYNVAYILANDMYAY